VRRDHRPYWLHQLTDKARRAYVQRVLTPQFDAVGVGLQVIRPRDVEIIGPNIRLGHHVHINAARGHPVKLCVWFEGERLGRIDIGDYALVSPGSQIISSVGISIGANTMLASGVYISDSDWHGTYDRTREAGQAAAIVIEDNVWLGLRAIVGKGVRIGKNSIVGAGSVVTSDIPPNVIAAGNPASVRRELDPATPFQTRADYFADPAALAAQVDGLNRAFLKNNTTLGWLRSLVFPTRED
jgi:acetyltransferase-like isoleucine patch superfamily enzyme